MISVSALAGGLLFGYLIGQSVAVKYYFYKAGKNSKDKLTKEDLISISPEELQELIDKGEVRELTQEEYEAELRRQNRRH